MKSATAAGALLAPDAEELHLPEAALAVRVQCPHLAPIIGEHDVVQTVAVQIGERQRRYGATHLDGAELASVASLEVAVVALFAGLDDAVAACPYALVGRTGAYWPLAVPKRI